MYVYMYAIIYGYRHEFWGIEGCCGDLWILFGKDRTFWGLTDPLKLMGECFQGKGIKLGIFRAENFALIS